MHGFHPCCSALLAFRSSFSSFVLFVFLFIRFTLFTSFSALPLSYFPVLFILPVFLSLPISSPFLSFLASLSPSPCISLSTLSLFEHLSLIHSPSLSYLSLPRPLIIFLVSPPLQSLPPSTPPLHSFFYLPSPLRYLSLPTPYLSYLCLTSLPLFTLSISPYPHPHPQHSIPQSPQTQKTTQTVSWGSRLSSND